MGYAVRDTTHRYVEWRDWATGAVVARELCAMARAGDFETIDLAGRPEVAEREQKLASLLTAPAAQGK